MRISFTPVNFLGKPRNYSKIDDSVSRSAQPQKADFKWLKDQGVTDVINFRLMKEPGINFDEKATVEALGMNYHSIPSVTAKPNEKNIEEFLSTVDEVTKKGGKTHIHCKAGADRTGMYAYIYKALKGIGSPADNEAEWINMGHHFSIFPDLIDWTKNFLKKFKK